MASDIPACLCRTGYAIVVLLLLLVGVVITKLHFGANKALCCPPVCGLRCFNWNLQSDKHFAALTYDIRSKRSNSPVQSTIFVHLTA